MVCTQWLILRDAEVLMWSAIAYGVMTALALVCEALYIVVRHPPWYHYGITGLCLLYFGSMAVVAWRLRQARKLVIGVSLLALLGLAGDTHAMTCTTHTYYVDGRYVMCQTCCTNGMCNTMCF